MPEEPQLPPRKFETWIVRLLIIAAALAAVVLIFGEGLIHRNPQTVEPEAVAQAQVQMPDPPVPAALEVLKRFFEAPDTESKAAWIHDSSRVLPNMEDFHDRRNHPYPTLSRVSRGQLAEFGAVRCVLFEIEPFSGPSFPVAVRWDGRQFAVDWESLTAYGTMDWNDFLSSCPATPQQLRVFVRQSNQDISGMSPGSRAFLVEHRDHPQPLLAMADGPTAMRLTGVTENARVPATLEIAWRPTGPGGAPVAHIIRVIATGWSR